MPVLFSVAPTWRVPRAITAQAQTLGAYREAAQEGAGPQEAQFTGNQTSSEVQKSFQHSGEDSCTVHLLYLKSSSYLEPL